MGLLTLADFIGFEVCLEIIRASFAGDLELRPAPMLAKSVEVGRRRVGERALAR